MARYMENLLCTVQWILSGLSEGVWSKGLRVYAARLVGLPISKYSDPKIKDIFRFKSSINFDDVYRPRQSSLD